MGIPCRAGIPGRRNRYVDELAAELAASADADGLTTVGAIVEGFRAVDPHKAATEARRAAAR